jgi:NAD+ diphosphatase
MVSQGSEAGLAWLGVDDVARLGIDTPPLLLGWLSSVAHFVVDISAHEHAVSELNKGETFNFVDARTVTSLLSGEESGIVAQAKAQVSWHNRTGFCSVCGHKTEIKRGGQVRHCPNCDTEHYPRTDPVVITVVSDGDRCLLGQSRRRGPRTNTFSALAGFVDQGESIEEAVAREVMEESGITVGQVRYHSSQPWPFPHSLMIGCHADAATTEISFDDEEMADVRWFQRDEVFLALDGKSDLLVVPGPIAIAHHIIKAWATTDAP